MDIYALCRERFPHLPAEREFSFSRHTTIGCGGVAAVAVSPAGTEETAALISLLRREKIAYCFLGAGANTLASDGRFEGVVIRFAGMRGLALAESLYVGAGVTGGELLGFARANALAGFAPFAGIPMTAGGAAVMNAGVRECYFGERVERVVGVENGKIRVFSQKECAFSEKSSIFQDGIAVTGVYLRAERGERARIEAETEFFRNRRRALPKGRSMGCTFVNPPGGSAGKLIEACGLKGKRAGLARVSEEHANFILNEGDCAANVARLVDEVREEVFRKTGVLLREEIRRLRF